MEQLAGIYRKTLLEDVVPFWMRHAVGAEDGAINNCLDDAGNVVSRDRYLWSQGRALWTFSALYNRVEARQEWLEVASGICGYLMREGLRDREGRWMFRLDEAGRVLDRDTSIYVDGFVISGLGEYFAATGDERAALIALETYECIDRRLRSSDYEIAPYSIPEGLKTLGIPMIFSFFFFNLGKATDRPDLCDRGCQLAREILRDFYVPDRDAILEYVPATGEEVGHPKERVCIPGHVIEAMWFLVSIFETTGDSDRIRQCCDLIRRHLELGWDDEYGGLRLALDITGSEEVAWQKADCKPWWVQTEALVATAYAHLHTGASWCMDWHRRVHEYAYANYPAPTGEWVQWLDRRGNKAETAALPVKDPFHLPRSLIYLMELLGGG